MLIEVTYAQVALRLVLTVAAGSVIGFDRNKGGHPAGLGTTILVGLAASLAMVEANLLLPTGGKTAQSFGSLDFMRLPLGILTGMGFLGAGAILRRGNHVEGLTTAATLWVTTVVGLCFGAGELALGATGTGLCVAVGVVAKRCEALIAEDRTASLAVKSDIDADLQGRVEEQLAALGFSVVSLSQRLSPTSIELCMRVRRRSREPLMQSPAFLFELAQCGSIQQVAWVPEGAAEMDHLSER